MSGLIALFMSALSLVPAFLASDPNDHPEVLS
jgi:hypothetical protein